MHDASPQPAIEKYYRLVRHSKNGYSLLQRSLSGLICLLFAGCGGAPSFAVTHLQGGVSVDGQPIVEGLIQFIPMEKDQGTVAESPIIGGRYNAAAVPLGKVSVQFIATRDTGEMIRNRGTPYPKVESLIPPKFQQGIELEVLGENLSQDFELSSK